MSGTATRRRASARRADCGRTALQTIPHSDREPAPPATAFFHPGFPPTRRYLGLLHGPGTRSETGINALSCEFGDTVPFFSCRGRFPSVRHHTSHLARDRHYRSTRYEADEADEADEASTLNIAIFGSGYVGLVTAACFSDAGNDVLCVDIDAARVEGLTLGDCPIHEPGLPDLLEANAQAGRLRFTTSAAQGVAHGLYRFIAVGTPPCEDGSADLQYVLAVANSKGQHMREQHLVIGKSTVPVGAADHVHATIASQLHARDARIAFEVVSIPEFLKEGTAVSDFNNRDRIVVGVSSPKATQLMLTLYAPFNRNHDRVIVMDVRSSELTK